MGKQEIWRIYGRNARQDEFGTYPGYVKDFFRDNDFSYVKSLQLKGIERFSTSKMKRIQEWYSAEAYLSFGTTAGNEKFRINSTNGKPFESPRDGLETLIEEVKSKMPEEPLLITFDRNAPEEEFSNFPPYIEHFFRDECFSHVETVHVKGKKYYSRSRCAAVKEWRSVEAYGRGNTCLLIHATPRRNRRTFRNFDEAQREFMDEAYRTGCRIYIDRDDEKTYRGRPGIAKFFDGPRSNGIQLIEISYSRDDGGYVGYAVSKERAVVFSLKRGYNDVPFDKPTVAARAFFEQLMRGRSEAR